MKKIIVKSNMTAQEFSKLVNAQGYNSELFGDEETKIVSSFISLARDVNKFGVSMTQDIPDCWGGVITVVCIPVNPCHEWHF